MSSASTSAVMLDVLLRTRSHLRVNELSWELKAAGRRREERWGEVDCELDAQLSSQQPPSSLCYHSKGDHARQLGVCEVLSEGQAGAELTVS
jgi:hypothetical protein